MSDIGCTLKVLPDHQQEAAAEAAVKVNPSNRPSPLKLLKMARIVTDLLIGEDQEQPPNKEVITPFHLAVMTQKYWGAGGVKLTVSFPFDQPAQDLQQRILSHMNAWGSFCNAKFVLTTGTSAQVRVARTGGDGYWSYLGTDVLSIPSNQPTMNLEQFTMNTPEGEYHRVVRHETGHTLGFPHEHMRKQLVARIDPVKATAYFLRTQGWSAQVTKQQVLTPLDDSTIMGTPDADQDSIMCYQLPGSVTTDGQPIRGGVDIESNDQAFAAKLYPLAVTPPPVPPPPPAGSNQVVLEISGAVTKATVPGFTVTKN